VQDQKPANGPKRKPKRKPTLRICAWCSNPFVPENKRGPLPDYCKASCKQRAYEERARQAELDRIHARHEQQLHRIFGSLGKTTASKARKAAEESAAEEAGPGPQIEGQEELTW
jgi:hypothetical protein